MQGWFSAKLGSNIRDGSQLSAQFLGPPTANSHRDITNRNQPLIFIPMDPTNSIAWTRKSFIEFVVSCRVGFQQNFGQKSGMDPSCQLILVKPRPQSDPALLKWTR
jgi:hypothetical protein